MYIAILGRQSDLSMAELEAVYGSENVDWFSGDTATVKSASVDINRLGGCPKAGLVTAQFTSTSLKDAGQRIAKMYSEKWVGSDHKITLGISHYGADSINPRDVQKIGIAIKQSLKKSGVSIRLIPNTADSLNTATSHHNKLGLSPNKVELLIVKGKNNNYIVAESTGAQNITSLARRDQGRPKRDAFVGMLPPKLAMIMVNLTQLAAQQQPPAGSKATALTKQMRLLDPFCGTGVVLQEAALMGYLPYGTDLSEKMVDYTTANLSWLKERNRLNFPIVVNQADAMKAQWQQPIGAVVCETYLGQPFSAPPSAEKLKEVNRNVSHITTTFLENIGKQLPSGTPLCLAIPAWFDANDNMESLDYGYKRTPTGEHYAYYDDMLRDLGYWRPKYKHTWNNGMYYRRPGQVVGREIVILVKL